MSELVMNKTIHRGASLPRKGGCSLMFLDLMILDGVKPLKDFDTLTIMPNRGKY